eukprot:364635-Chlamydomonas_euryale.AAC.7
MATVKAVVICSTRGGCAAGGTDLNMPCRTECAMHVSKRSSRLTYDSAVCCMRLGTQAREAVPQGSAA